MSDQKRGVAADLKLPNSKILGEAGIGIEGDFILSIERIRKHPVRLSGVGGTGVSDLVTIDVMIPSANHNMIWRNRQVFQQFRQPLCSFLIFRGLASICNISAEADDRRPPFRFLPQDRGGHSVERELA